MSEPAAPFEYTGGFGAGPCGSAPCGSNFTDENTGPPRPDVPALDVVYEDQALVIDNE